MNEQESVVCGNLINLKQDVNKDTLLSLVYIAGYVEKSDKSEVDDTKYYYAKFLEYFDSLNRGGLHIPTDNVVQWTIFCFILFGQMSNEICRTFLMEQFVFISKKYQLTITKKQCRVLANIFLKNYDTTKYKGGRAKKP